MVKFLSTFYLFSLHAVLWNRWCYYYYETTSQLDNVKCVNASLYWWEKYWLLKNIYSWKIFTPDKYSAPIVHKILSLSLSLILSLSLFLSLYLSLSFCWSGQRWRTRPTAGRPTTGVGLSRRHGVSTPHMPSSWQQAALQRIKVRVHQVF